MPTRTLIGDLADLARLARPVVDEQISYQPLDRSHRERVAELYQVSYPPEVGATDFTEALAEMDATYAGDYGQLITDASLVACRGDQAVGSIQIVHRSPWDPDLDCPFIIELFVRPDARELGIGRSLLARGATACLQLGETQIALRTGDGTSPAAEHLYRLGGMHPRPAHDLK